MRALVLLPLVIACGDGRPPARPGAPLGQDIARVNQELVSQDEVARLARTVAISPKQALHDLVSERLLVQHAEHAGYAASPEVQRAEKQALVRALLASELGSDAGDDEARRAKLAALLARLQSEANVRFDEAAIERAFAPPAP